MSVSAKVANDMGRILKGLFAVDDPISGVECVEQLLPFRN
jgi:hypothetical protein